MLIPPKSKMMSASDDVDREVEVNHSAEVTQNGQESNNGQGSNGQEKQEEIEKKNGEKTQEEQQEEDEEEEEEEKVPTPPPVSRGFITRPQDDSSVLSRALNQTHISSNVEIREIPIGDPKVRSKIRFEVFTAKVIETAGKKHVSYSISMKRANGNDNHPAILERRYSDFCFVYECILRNFHPSILGDFMFPKKVLIGNFKAEVITERTEAFHKFLNIIANCDNLLYSEYFYSFLSSEEHNEAVSHIKLSRYDEAVPLLESIFAVREKLLTISNIHVLQSLCELVATLHAVRKFDKAFSYVLVAVRSFEYVKGHPDAEVMRVSFLKVASELAQTMGKDRKGYEKQLAELRYQGVKLENAKPLLEIIRERYIHRASHTAKLM